MSENVTLSRYRNIRLTPAQDDRLREMAREEGLGIVPFIRSYLIKNLNLPRDSENRHAVSNSGSDGAAAPPAASTEGVASSDEEVAV